MTGCKSANHPCVVWGSCFLWFMSMLTIIWSIMLFYSLGDILFMTNTDMVNAIMLLSGLLMLPTNIVMLYSIAKERRLNQQSSVICCPLWLCIGSTIAINIAGACLCLYRIWACEHTTETSLSNSMKFYQTDPKHKNFIDNLQWVLRCCGNKSYKDWFSHDWYDKTRDYEWDPNHKQRATGKDRAAVSDSVPLSCCKSGSCIYNYLNELGTHSINMMGCSKTTNLIIFASMTGHLIVFSVIAFCQTMVLWIIYFKQQANGAADDDDRNVRHIMQAKIDFVDTSETDLVTDNSRGSRSGASRASRK